ncbi:MAG: UDP-N-acetylmuramate dehydrogenase [Phototrophicales bacterium]|nr:UDP-N-acetylmuramate dehydrogenase [Phototrophicales bacterium]
MPLARLQARLGNKLLLNEPMSKYTAARIGGIADAVYIARESADELAEVMHIAWVDKLPVRVIGGGANVLISDKGVRGLIVINRVAQVEFGNWYDGVTASVTGGMGLTAFSHKCQSAGYAGMEWAVSVPGTVGGSVVNNAGAHGGDIAMNLASAVVLMPNGAKLLTNEDLAYAYRHSSLKSADDKRFLVLLATFRLTPDDPLTIKTRMDVNIAHRKKTQPPGASLGSIFKNPPNDYAGRLIEATGLKGYRVGNAMVSPVHANFFINDGGDASASDYYALIRHVQNAVYEAHRVMLQMEVELLGEWE